MRAHFIAAGFIKLPPFSRRNYRFLISGDDFCHALEPAEKWRRVRVQIDKYLSRPRVVQHVIEPDRRFIRQAMADAAVREKSGARPCPEYFTDRVGCLGIRRQYAHTITLGKRFGSNSGCHGKRIVNVRVKIDMRHVAAFLARQADLESLNFILKPSFETFSLTD